MKLGRVEILLGFLAGVATLAGYLALEVAPRPAVAETTAPVPKVAIKPLPSPATNSENLQLEVTTTPQDAPGKLTPIVNNVPQSAVDKAARITVKLTHEGQNTVSVELRTGDVVTARSDAIVVELDKTGPILQRAEVVELPATGTTVIATFADDDFLKPLTPEQFQVIRQDKDGKFTSAGRILSQGSPEAVGRTVRLAFASLPAGLYRLVVKGKAEASNDNGTTAANPALKDVVGNFAGPAGKQPDDQSWEFSVPGERKFGQHVEFAPFVPPTPQAPPLEGFNPGDFVETRVARLYYYRDAHRVAEIINRNVRSYNRAAVTLAERRAEAARTAADDATDQRRQAEREAVRAAEQARNAEQQLQGARQVQGEVQDIKNSIATKKARIDEIGRRLPNAGPTERPQLEQELEQLRQSQARDNENLARFGPTDGLPNTISSLEQTVANLRQTELAKQEEAQQAEAKESRAKAQQFRDEVSAAETDPDTYVAGNPASMDPVTQVSISVIGEGLIQLRGPIKGINKIRTMINQIDTPVGQIKIGIFTVQVNGEQGDKMEKVIGDAEGHIDLSRFLVNQSLNLLRRSIQAEAALIAEHCAMEGHYQVDRDRRYLYTFFGRDFIDELYEMNSEFLFSENKLLSLHAMDTVSLNRALFILALAKNDVRERIIARFLESAKTELADAEFDFRRSSELRPHRTEKMFPPWNRTHLPLHNKHPQEARIYEAVHRNAMQRYHFRNFSGFFNTSFGHPDTMNPMQREFIRLAQIFKARLVAEMELKQRVLERGLIEDRSNDERQLAEIMGRVRTKVLQHVEQAYVARVEAESKLNNARVSTDRVNAALLELRVQNQQLRDTTTQLIVLLSMPEQLIALKDQVRLVIGQIVNITERLEKADWLSQFEKTQLRQNVGVEELNSLKESLNALTVLDPASSNQIRKLGERRNYLNSVITTKSEEWRNVQELLKSFDGKIRAAAAAEQKATVQDAEDAYADVMGSLNKVAATEIGGAMSLQVSDVIAAYRAVAAAKQSIDQANNLLTENRVPLDQRKLLNHLIDEQEDKFIELLEGTRSHIAVMDDYLKRLSIALEDDFKVQFYDPAFVNIRDAARATAVNLGQVERTTILTNNRAFAKVDPQATMEFDLPKRQIAIKEAFDAAKALVEDTGALVNDPTFLAAFQMMGGSRQPATVKNVLPGMSTSASQQSLGLAPPPPEEAGAPGSALQSLVPEPSIFKLETGTGFQLRPVMQPDGDSVVYDFDYMYTTNIREPVRADEKHLGRIKRHFVHTAVQTGNFELREISRYQVALKVSRTSRGVPLLEDVPVVGLAFKPAPSDESSIQQNIILGQTNVYPTLFDLMGLRWAPQVVDLNHTSLLESEHIIRGRQKLIRDHVYGVTSEHVDKFLGIHPSDKRPDLYHPQGLPSPHHPGGHVYQRAKDDPTGNGYERTDRRPAEWQEPPYDRFRHQPVYPPQIGPQPAPEAIPSGQPRPAVMELQSPTGEVSTRRAETRR